MRDRRWLSAGVFLRMEPFWWVAVSLLAGRSWGQLPELCPPGGAGSWCC